MSKESTELYNGDRLGAWEDEDSITITFYDNFVSLHFLKKDWSEIKFELDELINGEKNNKPAV